MAPGKSGLLARVNLVALQGASSPSHPLPAAEEMETQVGHHLPRCRVLLASEAQ